VRPPVIVRTEPEAYASLEEVDRVRFEFDERISERVTGGTLNEAVTVSPRGGDVRVSHGRRSLTVRMDGGFQPDRVYRVTLKAVVSDMFGNRLSDPFELVFSTGAEPVPTTLAGEVWDRLSGGGARDALVYATDAAGEIHQATADPAGIFALRYLPAGTFTVTAFEDVNRNGEIDSTEVQGATSVDLAEGDTVLIDLPILTPDTAAAVLLDADVLDSVTIVLEFDDYLDPDFDLGAVLVGLRRDEGAAPGVVRLYQEAGYAEFVEAVADSLARLDSIEAEEQTRAARAARAATPDPADSVAGAAAEGDTSGTTVPADTLAGVVAAGDTGAVVPGDTAVSPAPADTVVIDDIAPAREAPAAPARRGPTRLAPLQGSAPGPTADGRRVLPGQRLVAVLDDTLPLEVTYTVEVSGIVNINGLTDGGGSVEFEREPPPPPDTVALDSLAADSAAVPDTGAAGRR
jgi:hypothetical protein